MAAERMTYRCVPSNEAKELDSGQTQSLLPRNARDSRARRCYRVKSMKGILLSYGVLEVEEELMLAVELVQRFYVR